MTISKMEGLITLDMFQWVADNLPARDTLIDPECHNHYLVLKYWCGQGDYDTMIRDYRTNLPLHNQLLYAYTREYSLNVFDQAQAEHFPTMPLPTINQLAGLVATLHLLALNFPTQSIKQLAKTYLPPKLVEKIDLDTPYQNTPLVWMDDGIPYSWLDDEKRKQLHNLMDQLILRLTFTMMKYNEN